MHAAPHTVSLTSTWFIRPGHEPAAVAAIEELAPMVRDAEPDTLAYLVHTPFLRDSRLPALPPVTANHLVFFEVYRDADAFLRHLHGPVFTRFVERHAELFVAANGKPFTFVEFLECRAGFVRPGVVSTEAPPANHHPAVMFELIARDQARLKQFYQAVFGWAYTLGTDGFAYVKFAVEARPALGGIGQTLADVPGFGPGHNFYLEVDDLDAAIARAVAAGGAPWMPPTAIDGYHFAMVKDPEGNPIGLIKPW